MWWEALWSCLPGKKCQFHWVSLDWKKLTNNSWWSDIKDVVTSGTAEGEGLVGPRPHHFFAPPLPLFALKRKIIKIKKRLETSFFPSIFRFILCIFFNFKRQAFCGASVLFAVIVPWGRLAPWSNAMPWPPLRFVWQRVLYFQLWQSFFCQTKWRKLLSFSSQTKVSSCFELIKVLCFVFLLSNQGNIRWQEELHYLNSERP